MIPLSVPNLSGNESVYVSDCIKTGWISSVGKYVSDFEDQISSYTKSKHAIACMNGTVGLHTALRVIGISNNDIVLTTNLTFVATLNSITYTGAESILFDINKQTWQIDLDLVETWLLENTEIRESKGEFRSFNKYSNKRIGAIVPVHVLGGLVDIEKLLSISSRYFIPIIEDSTEALGSSYKGKYAGTFGSLGIFSFNGNKIISTGGGGMIVTDSEIFGEKAKHITTTAKTDPLNYFHDEIGYNYRLVNVLAAIGVAQMENFSKILDKKKSIDKIYRKELKDLNKVFFQKHLESSDPNCWLFTFRTPNMRKLLEYLNFNGIQSRPLWTPMNRLPMFSRLKYISKEDDISGQVFSDCISIPSSSNLSEIQQEQVIKSIKKFYNK